MLIDQCRAGVAAAWERFFEIHYAPTSRFLRQLIPDGTPEEILGVCQDTFLAAIRNLGSFSGRSRARTWLFRIAANKARDFRDRRLATNRGGGRAQGVLGEDIPPSSDDLEPVPSQISPSSSDWPTSEETMLEVRRSLDLLGGSCREILELRYFADFDDETLGTALGLNPRTVSSRLSRCLGKLGELLRQGQPAAETTAESV